MDILLKKSDPDLIGAFLRLKNRQDVADLLEITDKTLIFLLYRNKENNYKTFQIPKKSGEYRTIHAPASTLKIVQRKLNYILMRVHKPRHCAHGFLFGKSIKTNARGHVGNNKIINIDLEDFFSAIIINRVIGLFMSKPYELPKEVAVVLAQICCSPFGYLPQGAPTSPIVSNMICARLDNQMRKLARERKCVYTRYADDITFSSLTREFSRAIVSIDYIDGQIIISLGDILEAIIRDNGFKINRHKIRYRNRGMRQEVTGLVINEKVNVRRKLMRQVRAMLHYYQTSSFSDQREKNLLLTRITGKLNFIRYIRGDKDRAYRVLANRYNLIVGRPEYALNQIDEIRRGSWLLEVDGYPNGTAFMLNGKLITCYHVIYNHSEIKACRWENEVKITYGVSIFAQSSALDLAILKFDKDIEPRHDYSLTKGDSSKVTERQIITVAGYASFNDYKILNYPDVKVLSIQKEVYPFFFVSPGLVSGMSGGPAINEKNEVIGVVMIGSASFVEMERVDRYGVRPIEYLEQVK